MEDITGIHISSFQTIIENYESLIKELNNDLDFFKNEHESLKIKISIILDENKRLNQELKQSFSLKENEISLYHDHTDLTTNLKQQVQKLLDEKECTTKLWQNSLRTIDFLEGELKVFQAGTQGFVPKKDVVKLKQDYEEKLNQIESKLSATQRKLEAIQKSCTQELGAKHLEIDKSLETQAGAFKIVKNLEEEVLNLQKRLQESEKIRLKLEKNIKEKEELVDSVNQNNVECREKVREAVLVVTAALNEKDAALLREKEAKDETQKLNETLQDIVRETENKIKNEVNKLKIEHNFKQEQLLKDLKVAEEEIKTKSLEIEKYTTKCKLLENEIEKFQRGIFNIDESRTSKLLVLEKNLESTFQKLLVSEKQNIQLVSEKDAIKNDLEQMASHYERTLKTKEIEKITLQNKIKQLQLNLDDSNGNLVHLTEKLINVNNRLDVMEKEYSVQRENYESSTKQYYENRIVEINNNYTSKIRQLQDEVDSKTEINRKWITETRIIKDNLEKLIADLKVEIQKLKRENKKLREKLLESHNKIEQYKTFMDLISKDVNKISSIAMESGNVI
ncbi:uncharacterized protein PFB0765w-like [Anoplophora glabripennis]|uniref:uncharacterized protein PFB0765w-like n=1 Tax=Anoplophora glabripennis TaxID=217634 RepID=UPI000874AFE7|nr:uncharacterized protein PFB0765w-like [Anoplophora glabripennis]